MGIDIIECNNDGYNPLVDYNSWRVAVINYAERFDKISRLERHMETDEVFILLLGSAELIIGSEKKTYVMESGKIYNVKKGTWHNIRISKTATVAVVENNDTGVHNTEYIEF